jgi:hypothetical protein
MAGLDVDPINSKYELTGGSTYSPDFTTGSLQIISVVPEPLPTTASITLALLAFGAVRRATQR